MFDQIASADKWLPSKKPLVISGPCSAETETQLLQTSLALAETGYVDVLRAGIWKPRTRPNSFEGVGSKGLQWLEKAKKLTGLKTAVEVAHPKHIEEALHANVDIFWIGARTTANPFSVQEIAQALQGVQHPIWIKNPINPDINLWLGAIERVLKAGITKIGAIHRGFSSYGNTTYRNAPQWQIPIELKQYIPHIMLICDPSHICGNTTYLQSVAQKALDLNYDGLMIESHINPSKAWSDAQQQVTPTILKSLIEKLIVRNQKSIDLSFVNKLEELRTKIDVIDEQIIELLGERMKISEKIGHYKKENNITILQPKRWNSIIERSIKQSKNIDLSKAFILQYLKAVHLESINRQNKVMNTNLDDSSEIWSQLISKK